MEQVVEVSALERLLEDPPGMGDRRLRDPAGGAADRVVAAVERRVGAGVVVRDHDRDRKRGDEHPGDGDDRARAGAPPDRVPDAHPGDDEPDLLLRRHREHGEDREGDEPVLVEVPEGEEQERGGERDRVKLVQGQPLRRRVEEIDECEPERRALAAEVLVRQPEDGQRTECDDDRLDDEQHLRARPDPPQRREGGQDRIEVRGEPRDLPPVAARHLEEVAVCRVPDRLHHVPEVVAAGVERAVTEDGQGTEPGRIRGNRRVQERFRSQSNASINSRQRAPRTSSLACSR